MPTLNEWFDKLMEREWGQNRISTQERRITDYNARLREPLGKLRLNQITPQVVESWLYELLEREGNRRCVQGAHDTLTAILAVAHRHQLVTFNAGKSVRYPDQHMQRRPHRVLNKDDYKRLLTACRDQREQLIICLLCEAGLRRSELIALRVGDIDIKQGLIHLRQRLYETRTGQMDFDLPKNRRTRTVAVQDSLIMTLCPYLAAQRFPSRDRLLFTRCNQYTNHEVEGLSGSSLYKLVKRIARNAGLHYDTDTGYLSPHALRKTGATIAHQAGVPPHIIQQQLGHAHYTTTKKHYIHGAVVEPLREYAAVFS